ncbi:MAG: hypothetical protein ACOCZ5_00830 [bacterium]
MNYNIYETTLNYVKYIDQQNINEDKNYGIYNRDVVEKKSHPPFKLKNKIDNIKDNIQSSREDLKDKSQKAVGDLKEKGKELINKSKEKANDAWDGTKETGGKIVSKIKDTPSAIGNKYSQLDKETDSFIGNKISKGVKSIGNSLKDGLTEDPRATAVASAIGAGLGGAALAKKLRERKQEQ